MENEILFIDRTIKHIRRVQDNMILLVKNFDKLGFEFNKWELIQRGNMHDLSKFSPPLVNGYIKTNEYFRSKRLNLPCSIKESDLKNFWEAHERVEQHHPEFKTSMSDLDICEMCCDLCAMSQEFNQKDYTEYFKEKLIKEVPLVKKYEQACLTLLLILQKLNEE